MSKLASCVLFSMAISIANSLGVLTDGRIELD